MNDNDLRAVGVNIDDQWWFTATDIEEATKAVHGVSYKPSHLGSAVIRMRVPKFRGGLKHAYLFRHLYRLRPEKFSIEVFNRLVRKNPKQRAGDVPGFPLSREIDDPSIYPLHPAYEGHLRSKAPNPEEPVVISSPPPVDSSAGLLWSKKTLPPLRGIRTSDVVEVHRRLTTMAARQEGGGENVLAFLDVFRDLLVAKAT